MALRFSPARGSASVVLNAMARGPAGATGPTGATGSGAGITVPGTTIANEIVLWNSTTGAAIGRATGTGFVAAVAGVYSGPRTLTAPAKGLTISNPTGAAGNPVFALADGLASLEGLATVGIIRQTVADTFTAGTLVANAELATMADSTFKGSPAGAGTAAPQDMTATQATAILNVFGPDSGSGGLKGLVPATVAGDAAKVLKGDGTWGALSGGGDLLAANNGSDFASVATAFGNIKQAATSSATGVVELATPAECVTGTDTARAVTPEGLTSGVKARTESFVLAASDETTAITAGTTRLTFRMPYALTVTDIRASLSVAQTSGSIFTVDVNDSGTTILSTKLTIDNGEKTSTSAATPRVISDTALADDAEITVDIDQIGDSTAKGLKVTIIGTRP